jgi:hypothetical protein
MRVLVLVRPLHFIPPEHLPGMIQGFVAWREHYREQMEVFEFFAGGGGGFGVFNVPDEATLHQAFIEYPFSPFSDIEFRPILDGDTALQQWQAAIRAMGGGS